ncbi:PREDICTED: transcription factor HIVEP3-like, partial [Rhagoletis zephyria]|uniref:transcription factor HIVEP3-like n=1 Tax=Rhagoletis zephyria TaxID=28612 RepID=UPI00081173B6
MLTLPSNSDEMEEKNPEQEAEEEEEDEGDEENQLSEVNELVIYRQIRNNQVSYICQRPLCGREFTKPIKLKFHDRSHSGVRPYRCRECGYTSTLKVNLSKHVHRLHDCDTENDDLIEEDAELLKVENELFEYAMKQLLGPSGENEEDEDEDEYLPPPPETAVSTSPSTLAAAAASSSPSTSATAVAAPSSEEDSLIICRRTRADEEEMEEEEEEEEELSDDSSSGIEVVEEEEEEEEEPDEAVRAYYEKLLEEFECPLKCRIVPDCQWRFASADDLRDHE